MNENEYIPPPDAGEDPELDAQQGAGTQRRRHDEAREELSQHRDTRGESGEAWKQVQQQTPSTEIRQSNVDEEAINKATRDTLNQEKIEIFRERIKKHNPNYVFTEEQSPEDLDIILREILKQKIREKENNPYAEFRGDETAAELNNRLLGRR